MSKEIIDKNVLQELRKMEVILNKKIVDKIISLYLEHTPQQIKDMEKDLEMGDIESFCRQAHTLKSSSGNVGAIKMAELCAALEKDSYVFLQNPSDGSYNKNEAKVLLQQLKEVYEVSQEMLTKLAF